MGDALARVGQSGLVQWSTEQKELIRKTVANACAGDDELALFLHVAATSGLDPLLKQIHAVKMHGRLSFIADINGLQARAAREPDYKGLDCAVVYEGDTFLVDQKNGEILEHTSNPFAEGKKPLGAWAVVHREGMRPFRSMVRFSEYQNPNNPLWGPNQKPSVMILKVAKSTAIRMAYPVPLGSVYVSEELDRADEAEAAPPTPVRSMVTEAKAARVKALAAPSKQTVEAAKPKPKATLVVDVKDGETEQQAKARLLAEPPDDVKLPGDKSDPRPEPPPLEGA